MTRGPSSSTVDPGTAASDPGGLSLSTELASLLQPDLYGRESFFVRFSSAHRQRERMRTHFAEHLRFGDSRAALVASVDPLLVAAYTDELDCVAMLLFPDWLIDRFDLSPGLQLLTVNTYARGGEMAPDLDPGPEASGRWTNFAPFIADFLTEDARGLEVRKSWIVEEEWERASVMCARYLGEHPGRARDGRPKYCARPAS